YPRAFDVQESLARICPKKQVYHYQSITPSRSSIEVDGEKYICLNTFSSRKAAEQDAAKIALKSIFVKIMNFTSTKTTDGVIPPIYQVFYKSILNEFAGKMKMEKPKYDTVKIEGLIPAFVSSLVFNGVKYASQHGVNKKEAKQLAARTAILSIIANPGEGMQLLEPITRNNHPPKYKNIQNIVSKVLLGQSHVPPKYEFINPSYSQMDQLASACGVKRKPKKNKKANKRAKTTAQ
ncbi:Double-stranded RNA-binding protein 4, partial [Bienertia sinuspersici]